VLYSGRLYPYSQICDLAAVEKRGREQRFDLYILVRNHKDIFFKVIESFLATTVDKVRKHFWA